jgi:hypothetical protein
VEAAVIERNINVEDVAVFERSMVGDAVTDDLVWTCAYGFGEVAVVEWGWVGL